jgi:hypothetical protein
MRDSEYEGLFPVIRISEFMDSNLARDPTWLTLGILIGAMLGMAYNNIGLWLSLGIVFAILGSNRGNLGLLGHEIYKLFGGK